MEKEFVSYEIALALKALGFEENCLASYYTHVQENFKKNHFDYRGKFNIEYCGGGDYVKNTDENYYISAPLYQQVFEWFRKQHELRISNYRCIIKSSTGIKIGDGFRIFKYGKDTICTIERETYREGEIACIEKIIEILKEIS